MAATSARAMRISTREAVQGAMARSPAISGAGIAERLFALAFQDLVYPQIWEDPVVDMEALALRPDDHVVAIASGSCNLLSYLTAAPVRISAVDLNAAHVALGRLKVAAARHLPDHATFLAFAGYADRADNVRAYEQALRPHLDPATRAYWDGRRWNGKRRIQFFADNIYRHGLLGRCLRLGRILVRLHGRDPSAVLRAGTPAEQRAAFRHHLAPVFDKPLVRWAMRRPASLFGLGIPPAQYRKLAGDGSGGIAAVLKERLARLACGFDTRTNYFAWQAFGGGYERAPNAALPPYLQEAHFETLRRRVDRLSHRQCAMTEFLAGSPDGSVDAVVLLDAQDWMGPAELSALWREITRAARPGARVIFRTAGRGRLLPGRVPPAILDRWVFAESESRALGARDRSGIYGAFHLYRFAGPPAA